MSKLFKKKLQFADHCDLPISTGKLPVEIDQTNKGQIWLLFGEVDRGDGRAVVMVEHYNGELVVRLYEGDNDEPQSFVLIEDVDAYMGKSND